MIDPRTVVIAIPCYSGQNMSELTGAIWSWQGLFEALSMPAECSHPSLVRNIIAGQFLESKYEWLVCVDNDIVPSRSDLELLLQPIDPQAIYYPSDASTPYRSVEQIERDQTPTASQPTRIEIPLVVDGQRNLNNKVMAQADVLVNAEYCYKDDELRPVKFGMGFTRIHRSVFRTLEALKHPENPLAAQYDEVLEYLGDDLSDKRPDLMEVLKRSRPDPGGGQRLWQTTYKGRLYTDFFPSGPLITQHVPMGEWKGEDHGFFTLCMLAGIVPRIETRTRLIHIGRKGYPYLGPDTGLAI
jgi:hypothetical protein